MSDCPRFGRLVNGCRFEARYDARLPEGLKIGACESTAPGIATYVEALKSKTYVHDVCVRCGKIAKREKAA